MGHARSERHAMTWSAWLPYPNELGLGSVLSPTQFITDIVPRERNRAVRLFWPCLCPSSEAATPRQHYRHTLASALISNATYVLSLRCHTELQCVRFTSLLPLWPPCIYPFALLPYPYRLVKRHTRLRLIAAQSTRDRLQHTWNKLPRPRAFLIF